MPKLNKYPLGIIQREQLLPKLHELVTLKKLGIRHHEHVYFSCVHLSFFTVYYLLAPKSPPALCLLPITPLLS